MLVSDADTHYAALSAHFYFLYKKKLYRYIPTLQPTSADSVSFVGGGSHQQKETERQKDIDWDGRWCQLVDDAKERCNVK